MRAWFRGGRIDRSSGLDNGSKWVRVETSDFLVWDETDRVALGWHAEPFPVRDVSNGLIMITKTNITAII